MGCHYDIFGKIIGQFRKCRNGVQAVCVEDDGDIGISQYRLHQVSRIPVSYTHLDVYKRQHLSALLSEDDGQTWPYSLLLDERNEVSYPDAKEADDGFIYVTYDHERVTEREILMARFTEEDIIKGKTVTCGSNFKIVVNKATGQPNIH